MEGLLKIEGVVFIPRTPFLYKTAPLGVHFGTKSGPTNYKKRVRKYDAKFYKKGAQKDIKMTPKWLPKSTPGAPKWLPNVRPSLTEPTLGAPRVPK